MNDSGAAKLVGATRRANGFHAYVASASRRSFLVVWCALLVIAGFASTTAIAAGPAAALTLPPSASEVARYATSSRSPEPGVVRQRPVGIDVAQLASGNAVRAVTVDLFDGEQITVDVTRIDTRAPQNYTWYGRIRGHAKSAVMITVINDQIAGAIDFGDIGSRSNARYQLNSTRDGLREIRELNAAFFPPDHPPGGGDQLAPSFQAKSAWDEQKISGSELAELQPKADSGATIDVLIVYSNQTAAAAGSAIDAQVQQAIDTANMVYANSGITTRLRLVGSDQINYDESGDYTTDLNWLASNTAVASLRNTYGADLVSMFVENGQYCGIGWVGPASNHAFTVVNRGCSSGNYSFPHEVGHNFGARHDIFVDATTTPYAYGHGYVDCIGGWRDVMGYPSQCGGARIPYFSNPNLTYGNPPSPLGVVTTADVTRVHNQNASTVANFRAATSGTTCSYALSTSGASFAATGGTGSIGVTAPSGCAWNTSVSASWITITASTGSAAGSLNYSVATNTGAARSGVITIGGQSFTIDQAGACTYSLSPTSVSVDAAGATGSTSVTTAAGCDWTASSSASWLTITSSTSGSGSAAVSYVASANGGGARSANLSVGGATFVVSQAGAAVAPPTSSPSPSLSATQLQFGNVQVGKASRAKGVTLTNNGGGTLTIGSLSPGGTNPGDFALSGTCAPGVVLAGGQACTLQFVFSPTAVGTRSATLDVATTGGNVSLTLAGTGTTGRTRVKVADE